MGPVICLVTDRRRWGARWFDATVRQAGAAAAARVHLVQIREPGLEAGVLLDLVAACVAAVGGAWTRIVVNDRIDVALAAGAHGVHLPAASVSASRVRSRAPRPFIVGRSVHSAEEARAVDPAELDYVVFGTVYATTSKPGREPAGCRALARAVKATTVPVLAVGGITPAVVPEVVAAGAMGVAAISLFPEDPAEVVADLGRRWTRT